MKIIENLIARTGQGDRYAFDQLYDLTSPKLYGIGMRLLGHPVLAEGALEESFVEIWRQSHHYDPAQYRPMPWLVSIARNTVMSMLRSDAELIRDHALILRHDKALASAHIPKWQRTKNPIVNRAIEHAFVDGMDYVGLTAQSPLSPSELRGALTKSLAKAVI